MPSSIPDSAPEARRDMTDAVSGFIAVIEAERLTPEARLAQLAPALDRLSLAFYEGSDIENAPNEAKPPERDYAAQRQMVAARFPDLGYYGSAPPGEGLDADVVIGDAVDDLTDIYSEMLDVAWCLAHASLEDAVRLFRFGFTHHWGRHVCDLRGAVHYELFGM